MIYLIVGRTGSGKDYLANLLAQKGLALVKSYSTRPKRSENEDSHIFITQDEADTFTDKVAVTNINGYEYFATAKQVNESDVYIIDPKGIEVLTKNMPDETFHIVYVFADDMERKFNAIKRAENKIKEEEIFDSRDEAEDEQFTEFEEKLKQLSEGENPFAENVTCVYRFENEYSETKSNDYANFLIHMRNKHNRFTKFVEKCMKMNLVGVVDDKCVVYTNDDDDNAVTKKVTPSHFADLILSDTEGMATLCEAYVMNSVDEFN